jgi:cytidylate kinase
MRRLELEKVPLKQNGRTSCMLLGKMTASMSYPSLKVALNLPRLFCIGEWLLKEPKFRAILYLVGHVQCTDITNVYGSQTHLTRKGVATMSVITISREFGSEGDSIAQKVAQTLDYHFVDQKFIGIILSQYGYVEFDKEYATLPTFWERFDAQREKQRDVMVSMLNRVIQAVAQHGNVVLLGRSGFEVLGRFADVFHVRLHAPFPVRIQRVMAQQSISFEQAEAVVKKNDRVRVAFVEEFYRVPWDSIHAFDLVINTGKVSPDHAADWIVAAARAFDSSLETDQPTVASIGVDRIMAEAVSDVLQCQETHR